MTLFLDVIKINIPNIKGNDNFIIEKRDIRTFVITLDLLFFQIVPDYYWNRQSEIDMTEKFNNSKLTKISIYYGRRYSPLLYVEKLAVNKIFNFH